MSSRNDVYTAADSFRARIVRREEQATAQLIRAWARSLNRLLAETNALRETLDERRAAGEIISKSAIRRMERYQALTGQVIDELQRLLPVSEEIITQAQIDAIEMALRDAPNLLQRTLPFPDRINAAIIERWNRLPAAAFQSLVGVAGDGAPLGRLLAERFGDAAPAITQEMLDSVALGRNPVATARQITNRWGTPLTKTMQIARTETLRAHRVATLASYRANSVEQGGVIAGWRWMAALQPGTCISCLANHGRLFTLEEPQPSHPNCRCTISPALAPLADLGIHGVPDPAPVVAEGDGLRWFERQNADTQRDILTPAVYRAWKDGKVTLEQAWHEDVHPEWGASRVASSLKRMLGEQEAKEYYA